MYVYMKRDKVDAKIGGASHLNRMRKVPMQGAQISFES